MDKNRDRKNSVGKNTGWEEVTPATDIDVRPADLLCDGPGFLRSVLLEVQRQWGDNMRAGTVFAYFDKRGILQMHFSAREPFKREGFLQKIVEGYLPEYFVNIQANVADSAASHAAELMVTLPDGVDANDPKWGAVVASLEALTEQTH